MEAGLRVDGLLEGGEELLLEAEDLADVAEERSHLGRVRQEQRVLHLLQRLQVGLMDDMPRVISSWENQFHIISKILSTVRTMKSRS